MTRLHLISAGAAQGLVEVLADRFREASGASIAGTFGAVGAMKEKLLDGAPCDVVVLTQTLLEGLAKEGQVRVETVRPLGIVYTGVAVRAGDPPPAIGTGSALRESLRGATSIHFPDPQKATAGVHFSKVLLALGVRDELHDRLQPHPNGATAMAALAKAGDAAPVGCTQVTEINATDGVALVGVLPKPFELATLYAAAVCTRTHDAALAAEFVELLAGPGSGALRRARGFVT